MFFISATLLVMKLFYLSEDEKPLFTQWYVNAKDVNNITS